MPERMECPQCGSDCERDEVDVGGGSVAAGPWGCPECQWVDRSSHTIEEVLPEPVKADLDTAAEEADDE